MCALEWSKQSQQIIICYISLVQLISSCTSNQTCALSSPLLGGKTTFRLPLSAMKDYTVSNLYLSSVMVLSIMISTNVWNKTNSFLEWLLKSTDLSVGFSMFHAHCINIIHRYAVSICTYPSENCHFWIHTCVCCVSRYCNVGICKTWVRWQNY